MYSSRHFTHASTEEIMKTLDRKKSSDEGNAIDPNLNTKEMQRFRDFPIEIQLKIWSHWFGKPGIKFVEGRLRWGEQINGTTTLETVANVPDYYLFTEGIWRRYRTHKFTFLRAWTLDSSSYGRFIPELAAPYAVSPSLNKQSPYPIAGYTWFDPLRDIPLIHDETGELHDFKAENQGNRLHELNIKTLAIRLSRPEWERCHDTTPATSCSIAALILLRAETAGRNALNLVRLFLSLEELILVRPDLCTHSEHLIYLLKKLMEDKYAFWLRFWADFHKQPRFLMPEIKCMTYAELEEHVSKRVSSLPEMVLAGARNDEKSQHEASIAKTSSSIALVGSSET